MDREATDITLFVRTSHEEVVEWDRRRIVNALILEASVDMETAEEISREVERELFSSGIGTLTAPLIRELVNAKLIERGFEEARRLHTRIGFPLYDIGRLITTRNKENANVPHWPEGTNLTLAEGIKREFALHSVFSKDVGDAHLSGDLHLHKLGYIDRPYSSIQSLEYVKMYGLSLPGAPSVARPAKYPDVLLAHMIRFSAALQGNFAASIEWDGVNLSFAPYLTGKNEREVKQLAQRLVYEFSQLAFARGGQVMFTDIHLYWDIPTQFERARAIGAGGKASEEGYEACLGDARRFLRALLGVFRKGDAAGRPFFFPRAIIHVTEKVFSTPEGRDFLLEACVTAQEKGNISFAMDRGNKRGISSAGRPARRGRADGAAVVRREMRQTSIGTVTLNLPRLAYLAENDDTRLFSLLSERMELAAKAQSQKRDFIETLLSYRDEGPLSFLAMKRDGHPYLRMEQAVYPIGMIGLNELIEIHTGKQLHESKKALEAGFRFLSRMKELAGELGRRCGLRLILEQTPAESTAYRFARLDLRYFSPKAGRFVRGDVARGEVYYTNSSRFNGAADLTNLERIAGEGMLHPLIEGTTNTPVWIGETIHPKEILAKFVETAFRETCSSQVTFSPEFTTCPACSRTFRGLQGTCGLCGSKNVEEITRITGYFARVSDLNRGKLSELRDLRRNGF